MRGRKKIANEILLREAEALLREGKRVKLRARGESMRPFIRGGEDTLVVSAPTGELRKDDIVLARDAGGEYVAHRIVEINGCRVTLMGDGNLYGREECRREDVLGVVSSIIREDRESSMTTWRIRMLARGWRMMLPIRRIRHKIKLLIAKKR
ncbi:MAG: S24/S26 family peptidase [Muribaculaceae bacterium]|nr:S24/S26 family peptidase [Muribaculaceae bacterium]